MREDLRDQAHEEGEMNVAIEELSQGEGDLTLDDIRNLPGAGGMSDEDLQGLLDESRKVDEPAKSSQAEAAAAVADATGGEAVKTSRGWKVIDEKGNEIADISKMSASDLLKHKFEYNANGKGQRGSLDDVIRVAKFGHLNERKLSEANAERQRSHDELQSLRPQLEQAAGINKAFKYAVTQYHLGNDEPLSKILSAAKAMIGQDGGEPLHRESSSSSSSEAEGQRVYYEEIQPAADAIAARYGAKTDEVRKAVAAFINNEPNLTRAKIDNYINEEIPLYLEDAGYKAGNRPVAATGSTEDLKRELAELKAQIKNSTLDTVKSKNRNLPSGGSNGGFELPEADKVIPASALKSASAYRKMLQEQ